MTRSPVPGDPTSLSQLGADALRAGRDLLAAAIALEEARALEAERRSTHPSSPLPAGVGRGGATARVRRDLEKRTAELTAAARSTGAELERIGRLLQDHAAELAATRHTLSSLRDEVTAAGLTLEGSHVGLPWGITGAADAASTQRSSDREQAQERLERLSASAARRRRELEREVRASTESLQLIRRTLSA